MDDVAYLQYHWERRRFKSSPENRSLEEAKSGGAQSWEKFVQKLGEERAAAAGARLQVQVRYWGSEGSTPFLDLRQELEFITN